ncbi:MAG: nucleotidyl transferase AbiEii/AbiGii toxin family protein [Deltaproteobacteria bacterium]|nr:nucleotidyl transferase AbiEii/AbiGii toxin family protein [Deltaproteobacteria bacterium]
MTQEPRTLADYGGRETVAARRVLVDLGQVLAAYFRDSIVVVGGWVPELLLHDTVPPHSGSIDVDLALDADRLRDGQYADVVESLLVTGRYHRTDKAFALRARVDLGDGGPKVLVDVEFMKSPDKRGRGAGRLPGFRPFDADGCDAAFANPKITRVEGRMITGVENVVQVLVASVPDFLVMKAYALAGRDKPKDAYDICFCLDHMPGGMETIASDWCGRRGDRLVEEAIGHLRDKFRSVGSFGPQQVIAFHAPSSTDEADMHARRAFELVTRFLELVGAGG